MTSCPTPTPFLPSTNSAPSTWCSLVPEGAAGKDFPTLKESLLAKSGGGTDGLTPTVVTAEGHRENNTCPGESHTHTHTDAE